MSSSSSLYSPLLTAALLPEAADSIDILKHCLDLAQDPTTEALAVQTYGHLRDRLLNNGPNVQTIELLDLLWNSMLSRQRAAAMWQHMCHTEQQLTDQMAESHVQLHQNYLRLVQEQ